MYLHVLYSTVGIISLSKVFENLCFLKKNQKEVARNPCTKFILNN